MEKILNFFDKTTNVKLPDLLINILTANYQVIIPMNILMKMKMKYAHTFLFASIIIIYFI